MMEKILHFVWCIVMPVYKLYVRITKRSVLELHTYISYNSKFEGHNFVGRNTYVLATEMGYGSYIAREGYLFNTKIGKYTCIGPRVSTICGRHPLDTFVAMHPSFFSIKGIAGLSYVKQQKFEEFRYVDDKTKKSVVIGNDVWIGEDVKIMEGVTIGDGAVIAAGTLVLTDVEPYSVVAGIPGKVKKYRFDREKRDALIQFKWWNKTEEWIRENASDFDNVEVFLSSIVKETDNAKE